MFITGFFFLFCFYALRRLDKKHFITLNGLSHNELIGSLTGCVFFESSGCWGGKMPRLNTSFCLGTGTNEDRCISYDFSRKFSVSPLRLIPVDVFFFASLSADRNVRPLTHGLLIYCCSLFPHSSFPLPSFCLLRSFQFLLLPSYQLRPQFWITDLSHFFLFSNEVTHDLRYIVF